MSSSISGVLRFVVLSHDPGKGSESLLDLGELLAHDQASTERLSRCLRERARSSDSTGDAETSATALWRRQGLLHMRDDFDEPLEDFAPYTT